MVTGQDQGIRSLSILYRYWTTKRRYQRRQHDHWKCNKESCNDSCWYWKRIQSSIGGRRERKCVGYFSWCPDFSIPWIQWKIYSSDDFICKTSFLVQARLATTEWSICCSRNVFDNVYTFLYFVGNNILNKGSVISPGERYFSFNEIHYIYITLVIELCKRIYRSIFKIMFVVWLLERLTRHWKQIKHGQHLS